VNISELTRIARTDFLNDAVGTVQDEFTWKNDFFLRSFSEAQRQACIRVDFLFTDSLYIKLKSGVRSYTLPTNLNRITALTFDGEEINQAFVEQLPKDWRNETGFSTDSNQRFIIRGNQISIFPKPDAIDNDLKLYIEGFINPEPFTSMSDCPVIPELFHKALIHWVCYEAYSNEVTNADYMDKKDDQQSQKHLALFNQAFGNPVSAQVIQHNFVDVNRI
jgi:hypothetical protein